MERTWLLEELKRYPEARAALGVVVDRQKSNPEDPDHYRALYLKKVLKAVRKSLEYGEDPVDMVDMYLLAG